MRRGELRRAAGLAATLGASAALASCTGFPWSIRTAALPPETGDGRSRPEAVYYTDLGPGEIDVSRYPSQQQEGYRAFLRVCASCHGAARAVNAPVESRLHWRFHMARMSLHSRARAGAPISKEDYRAVLDFLDYDTKARRDTPEFRESTRELKRRFEPVIESYLWRLYGREQTR